MGSFCDAARWVFCAVLVYAPWAYGGTTSARIRIINWLLLASLILWVIELLISWRTPTFSRLLIFLTFVLAGSAALGSNYFFCDLLLSRKCRGILESGLAASRRSGRARFYDVIPSRHARIVDERVYSDSCRSCG